MILCTNQTPYFTSFRNRIASASFAVLGPLRDRQPRCKRHLRVNRSTGFPNATGSSQATGRAPTLPILQSDRQLEVEIQWIAEMIQAWQDEEFLEQGCHENLGLAAAEAYRLARCKEDDPGGECDISNILFLMLEELQRFDYTPTFTGPFDVANKVVELLMVNAGQEVCCQSADDTDRLERFGTAQSRMDNLRG